MAFIGQLIIADGVILAVDGLKEKPDAAWNHGITMTNQIKLLGEGAQQGFNLIYLY